MPQITIAMISAMPIPYYVFASCSPSSSFYYAYTCVKSISSNIEVKDAGYTACKCILIFNN